MKSVLVDTSVLIDFLRRKDKTESLFYQVFSRGKYRPAVSLTTITELWAGKSMAKKDTFKFVNDLVKKCEIVSPSLETAKRAGKILRQADYKIAFQDTLIAALALENKLLLLTLDKKDFQKVKGIRFFP